MRSKRIFRNSFSQTSSTNTKENRVEVIPRKTFEEKGELTIQNTIYAYSTTTDSKKFNQVIIYVSFWDFLGGDDIWYLVKKTTVSPKEKITVWGINSETQTLEEIGGLLEASQKYLLELSRNSNNNKAFEVVYEK